MITVGFLVAFLVVFILLSVTIGKIEGSYNQVNCVTAKLPNDILNGYSGSIQFIGLFGLQDMLDNLLSEVDSISSATSSFDEIINLQLKSTATTARQSLKDFSQQYKQKQTIDGTGSTSVSHFTSTVTDDVNDAVKAEFNIYSTVAE
ncbi:MAG: hypothetical protein DHS20C13_28350 [Thermodesulfobacteriota bacterium]|nr:MAG: hypothetical protein DHS20C13_28350 [Thermodesulfobacteriota bacterium]